MHENTGLRERVLFVFAAFAASGAGVGFVPWAQGTFGSLWIPVAFHLLPLKWLVYPSGTIAVAVLALGLFFVGVWSSGVCERRWGHDPGRVVIDEVVGMLVTVLVIPLTLETVWVGFLLFRVFDIVKPWPVRRVERLPGGWGVMMDDVLAGVYAAVCLRILFVVLPWMS